VITLGEKIDMMQAMKKGLEAEGYKVLSQGADRLIILDMDETGVRTTLEVRAT
jgi:hypothetical protein